jgi:hypothetical protein
MNPETIDQEFEKLQQEFSDVATTVKALADKLQAAAGSGDTNAGEWLEDLKAVAKDIDDEQAQAQSLLVAIHGFITNAAAASSSDEQQNPPLFAPGHEPAATPAPQSQPQGRGGMFGGFGGGIMGGGGMMGGYFGGGFARAMEMGAGMSLGANLLNSILR